MVGIRELDHIVLFVRAIDRAAELYTDVLSFRPVIDRLPGQRGALYRTTSRKGSRGAGPTE